VDGGVVEIPGMENVDVLLPDGRGLVRDLDREDAERMQARLGRKLTADSNLDELFRCALCTEVVCVCANSVVAVVRA
jgi:hypothetical protein